MNRQTLSGGLFALGTFLFWGLMPIYFKALTHVPPVEVVAHRVVWSALLLIVLVAAARRWTAVVEALRERRTRRLLLASTVLIATNWLVFIWAVGAGRLLDTSLGYFINPLVNVALGVVFLGERLTPLRAVAVALAAAGVLNLALQVPGGPWVALVLAVSFGVYGLIRKTVRLGPRDGLLVETALLAPLALGYLVYLGVSGAGSFGTGDPATDGLLLLAGAVTTIPLLGFAAAARRLDYATVGFFQYIAPTCHFLLAVFIYGEAFTRAHLVTFALIWLALGVYVASSLRQLRRARVAAAAGRK